LFTKNVLFWGERKADIRERKVKPFSEKGKE
jgi:hypothetical protein